MIDLGNGIMEVILHKHFSELSPPVVEPGKSAYIEEIKKAPSNAAAARYKRSKKA